jgi:hypothetical protein
MVAAVVTTLLAGMAGCDKHIREAASPVAALVVASSGR